MLAEDWLGISRFQNLSENFISRYCLDYKISIFDVLINNYKHLSYVYVEGLTSILFKIPDIQGYLLDNYKLEGNYRDWFLLNYHRFDVKELVSRGYLKINI